jgi:hypothetical protein
VLRDQTVNEGTLRGVEVAPIAQHVDDGPCAVLTPNLQRGDKLVLVNQAALEGKQPEQQISLGVGFHRLELLVLTERREAVGAALILRERARESPATAGSNPNSTRSGALF